MNREGPTSLMPETARRVLQAYLLGMVDFETAVAFQRRLVYHVAGERSTAALILCEHPPLITVGRHGSRRQILAEPEQLRARQWRVRWVNRGGGCWLHLPGQLAIYPVLALDSLGLGLEAYLERLQGLLSAVLEDFGIRSQTRPDQPGLWVGPRLIAGIGVAVRDWVTYYGAVLNVHPDLEPFRLVRCGGSQDGLMTSLARERRAPLRPALVRERLLEHFVRAFGFERTALFSDHPSLSRKTSTDALPTHP